MGSVKLIVSYHKPDVLLKDEILTPVNAGRAVARQRYAEDDPRLKWLVENTIGDDTGENISLKNPSFNEMTSVYWAWKNYDTLGDPDYIGFMHYRRHFLFKDSKRPQLEVSNLGSEEYLQETLGYSPAALAKILKSCDFVYTRPLRRASMREHFQANHHIGDLDAAVEIINERHPHLSDAARDYLTGSDAIFCNMFIMPRELFFEYASFVFDVLSELESRADMAGKRMFVSEWLTGIFITDLLARGLKGKALPMVIAEGQHTIPIVVAASPSFVLPLSVTLTSLLENAGPNTSYDIHILVSEDYRPEVRDKVLSLIDRYPGTSISFVPVGSEFDQVEVATQHVRVHTYYRLIVPSRLPHLSRCIYLDADVVVERDLTPLLRTVVDDKYLAGVAAAGYHIRTEEEANKIGLRSYDRYVNAGVLLMNLDKIRRDGLEERFLALATQGFESDDQDVLNVACYDGIRILPLRYNVMTKYRPENVDEFFAYTGVKLCWTREDWQNAIEHPVVIHYADRRKPWLDASVDFGHRWWHYALLSPFRDEIVSEHLLTALDASHDKVVRYRSSLVSARRAPSSVSEATVLRKEFRPEEIRKYQDAVLASVRLERALKVERREHKSTKAALAGVRRSASFRVGRALTALPRKVRALSSGRPTAEELPPRAVDQPVTPPSPAALDPEPTGAPGRRGAASGGAAGSTAPHTAVSRRARVALARVAPSSRRQASQLARSQAQLAATQERVIASQKELIAAQRRLLRTVDSLGQSIDGVRGETSAQGSRVLTELAGFTESVGIAIRESAQHAEGALTDSVSPVMERLGALQFRAGEVLRATNESVWSQVFHDAVQDSGWFRDQALAPGRWAVGYPYLYVLYRLLDEMQPKSIVELGMGQSTRMIAQYAAAVDGASHVVVEHDEEWVAFFERSFRFPSESTQKLHLGLASVDGPDGAEVLRYDGFREALGAGVYDLICVDGPFGGKSAVARIDVLDLIPHSLGAHFAILLDDYNRPGEQRAAEAIRSAFADAGLEYLESSYHGAKNLWLVTSPGLSFFHSM